MTEVDKNKREFIYSPSFRSSYKENYRQDCQVEFTEQRMQTAAP